MPTAGPGRILRAATGHVGAAATDDGILLFNYGPGESQGPCLVGTRYFLAASQLISAVPPGGSVTSPGATDVPNWRSYQPALPWGSPGSLIRTPRTAVLVCRFMGTPSAGTDPFTDEFVAAIEAAVAPLVEAGVHVYLINPPSERLAGQSPLLGPCFLTGASPASVVVADGITMFAANATTDGVSPIGGDVWWGNLGSLHAADIGFYVREQIVHGLLVTPFPPVTDPGPILTISSPPFVNLGQTHVFDVLDPNEGLSTDEAVVLWPVSLDADAQQAAAVARRCRSFRFAFATNDTPIPVGSSGATLTPDPGPVVSRLPADLNAAVITSGSAGALAASVIDDMRNFFGIA